MCMYFFVFKVQRVNDNLRMFPSENTESYLTISPVLCCIALFLFFASLKLQIFFSKLWSFSLLATIRPDPVLQIRSDPKASNFDISISSKIIFKTIIIHQKTSTCFSFCSNSRFCALFCIVFIIAPLVISEF